MNKVVITIKKELRRILRDKKSLVMMLITPLTIPLFIIGFSYIYQDMSTKDTKKEYNVGVNYIINSDEQNIINNSFNVIYYENTNNLNKDYDEGKINAYIIKTNNNYKVYYNSMNIESAYVGNLSNNYLKNYNEFLAKNYLNTIGADTNLVYNNILYTHEELGGSNSLVNEVLIMGLVFAIMAITLSAIYSSTDATAGEKERGTLETILTFPIKSDELIMGKFLAIVISCLITSIISLILVIISLNYSKGAFEIYKTMSFSLGFSNIIFTFIILLSYSFFISGVCIVIASFAKSYKEAQSLLTPISMITIIPMFLDILEIHINPILSLVPIVSHTLLINEIFYGKIDILNIIIMLVSTIIYSIILVKIIAKMYKKESILFVS